MEPLTESYFYILLCLYRGPSHGYGIMQDALRLSRGHVHIGSGTMYGATSNMIKKGWIQELPTTDADRRRLYILTGLRKNYTFEILFLEASDNVILKRYKETRRVHPLSIEGDLMSGIKREREMLSGIRAQSEYVIDTTNLLTRELKAELDRIFVQNQDYNSLMINVMSFGFKHGIPQDADLVFDVRFLPNPFYIDDLKQKTGLDKEVQDYVMSFKEAHVFLDKLTDMISFLIPNYINEGKYQLVIAIGCTGGQHRSVTLAGELYKRLKDKGDYGLTLRHRDTK